MKYYSDFQIGKLHYRVYSNHKIVTDYFKKIYSLFDHRSKLKSMREKKIVIKDRTIDALGPEMSHNLLRRKIYKEYMENFSEKALFLHASSVMFNNRYILFIGPSNCGKSSLASRMKDAGGYVFADDTTLIEYDSGRPVFFPIFCNVRKGSLSELQKKYKVFFDKYFKNSKKVRREHVFHMPLPDFKKYLSYNKEFYSVRKVPESISGAEIAGIFLNKSETKIMPRIERAEGFNSLNRFVDSIHLPVEVFEKKLKSIMRLFGKIDFYELTSSSPEDAADLVLRNFKRRF